MVTRQKAQVTLSCGVKKKDSTGWRNELLAFDLSDGASFYSVDCVIYYHSPIKINIIRIKKNTIP